MGIPLEELSTRIKLIDMEANEASDIIRILQETLVYEKDKRATTTQLLEERC